MVLFIRRENYMPHPRFKPVPPRLSNEEEVLTALQEWAVSQPGAVSLGSAAHVTRRDCLRVALWLHVAAAGWL